MKLLEFLQVEAIEPELQGSDKAAVVRELATVAARVAPELNPDALTECLLARERLGSTGVGSGVAIPHGKMGGLDRIVAVFGRSRNGIDFHARDGKPVHLFWALVAPEAGASMHLKALARISRLSQVASFRDALIEAESGTDIWQVIQAEDEKL